MLSKKKKEQLKNKAITDLFNSGIIQGKIDSMNHRYRMPPNAGIQDDVLQAVFEQLSKYNTDKIIEMLNDNPKRLVGLATRICYSTHGYGKDHRTKKFWVGTAQGIMNNSTLSTLTYIDVNTETMDELHTPLIGCPDDVEQREIEYINMWKYIRDNLDEYENMILEMILNPEPAKMKGRLKKDYQQLLLKMKGIILDFKKINEYGKN